MTRLQRWLEAHGFTLNETKTRLLDVREAGFKFLGFGVRWRRGQSYPHLEPHPKSQTKLRDKLREKLVMACIGCPPGRRGNGRWRRSEASA